MPRRHKKATLKNFGCGMEVSLPLDNGGVGREHVWESGRLFGPTVTVKAMNFSNQEVGWWLGLKFSGMKTVNLLQVT